MCIRDWEACSRSECSSYGACKRAEGGNVLRGLNPGMGALCRTSSPFRAGRSWGIAPYCDILPSFWFMGDEYHRE